MSRVQIFVFVLAAFSIATSGCSKMQQTGFRPIQQARSLSDSEKQSVENILQRQDEVVRVAAEKAAAVAAAEAEAAAAEAKEVAADAEAALESATTETSSLTPYDDSMLVGSTEANMNSEFNVTQVSFETDAEDADADPDTPVVAPFNSGEFGGDFKGFSGFVAEPARGVEAMEDVTAEAMSEYESTVDSTVEAFPPTTLDDSNVTLMANVDDLEGVPQNIARDEIDLSRANFLRPSSDPELGQTSSSDSVALQASTEFEPRQPQESLQMPPPALPLQPMLFNASTREINTNALGTLRPLNTREIEPEVKVAKTEFVATPPALSTNFAPQPTGPLTPLTPLRNPTVKLESPQFGPPENSTFNSRLLEPLADTAEDTFEVPKTDFTPKVEAPVVDPVIAPVEVATAEPAPVMVSEEIIVVDPTPPAQPESVVAVAPPAPEVDRSGYPVVDQSLANASASYLKTQAAPIEVNEDVVIPAEVLEDADIVVSDIQKELEANSIPVSSFPVVDNDFKIQPTSNTTPAPLQIYEEERGEPMFDNNDFAEPESPGGEFVPPMTVVPAEVPTIEPKPLNAASTEFGGEMTFDAPVETDTVVAHVAALPVTAAREISTSNSKVPPVGVSTLMELNAVTWKSRLDEAIELAEERLNRINNPADSSVVNLRLLKALRGQMQHMESSPGTNQHSENESQYWQHQLEALTSMLASPTGANQAITDYHRHQTAHKTLEHLRNAVSQLESIASLKVSSGQFCTEITGFGQFRTFASNEFSPGQKMLVYCEVENYNTIQNQSATGTEFRTRLKGSFAIYDANGKVVQQAEYPTVDDIARKRRRDFYMYMPVTLGDLPSGQYVLHALVEDVHGNKTASLDPPLQFSVK